jgi:hypothetical protein
LTPKAAAKFVRHSLIVVLLTLAHSSGVFAEDLTGRTLSKKDITLPDGKVNVVIAGFSRESSDDATQWRQALSDVIDGAGLYSLVDLEAAPGFIRGMIVRSIRGDTPQTIHDKFLIVTDSSAAWRRAARVEDEDLVYVLKLSPAAQVCARVTGSVTQTAIAMLIDAPCPRTE